MRLAKQKILIKKVIKAHSSVREWKQDKKGYFLIRVNRKKGLIEAAFCNNRHVCSILITGKNAQDIYYTIIREKLVSNLQHAAYLGKELYKAEMALKKKIDYIQDKE